MNTEDTRWTAWHLHLSTLGAAATDRVVRHAVGPAIDAVGSWGATTEWFFVRYWQFGPHVRLRVAGLDGEHVAQLDRLLRTRMAELLAGDGGTLSADEYHRAVAPLAAAGEGGGALEAGELWPGGVYRQRYQPEVGRYGGDNLLPLSESLFQSSSEMALAFLRLDPTEAARSGLGLRATWAALAALADDDVRSRLCRRAARGWQEWAHPAGPATIPTPPPARPPEGRAPAPVMRWADQLSQAMTHWRIAGGEESAQRILISHIHMLHNRLGLSVGQERNHYLALAEWLSAGVPTGAAAP